LAGDSASGGVVDGLCARAAAGGDCAADEVRDVCSLGHLKSRCLKKIN
jgi:hypothetical protein